MLYYRKESGLTQEELAVRVSVARQTVIAFEKGSHIPSVLLALEIAKQLKKTSNNYLV